jgi:uroporphyrinogen decarboxylase
MTPKQRVIATLKHREPDQVPHCELQFQLLEEEFGPETRMLTDLQLKQASAAERERLLQEGAELFLRIAKRFEYCIIFVWGVSGEAFFDLIRLVRKGAGEKHMVGAFGGGGTYGIPSGGNMAEFAYAFYDRPEEMHQQAERMLTGAIEFGKRSFEAGAEMICLNTDYAFNTNPFLPPAKFREFVTPYLCRNVAALKEAGAWVMLHTDGNLMPIMDQLVESEAHALQSIDPQAGMDIAVVKQRWGDKLTLMGNVMCSLLQTGTREEMIESARYCLVHGKPGGGYIFSTSNVVFKGMPIENYYLILDVWKQLRAYR